MVFNILTAAILLLALGATIWNTANRSYLYSIVNGTVYIRKSALVKAAVRDVVWAETGGYLAMCVVPGEEKDVEIHVPDFVPPVPVEILLLRVENGKEHGYMLAPKENAVPSLDLPALKLPLRISQEQWATLAPVIEIALACLSLMFLSAAGFFSLILSLLAFALAALNRPYKKWTSSRFFVIIKGKEFGKKQGSPVAQDGIQLPAGYETWSDTEKNLFRISLEISQEAEPAKPVDEDPTALFRAEDLSANFSDVVRDTDANTAVAQDTEAEPASEGALETDIFEQDSFSQRMPSEAQLTPPEKLHAVENAEKAGKKKDASQPASNPVTPSDDSRKKRADVPKDAPDTAEADPLFGDLNPSRSKKEPKVKRTDKDTQGKNQEPAEADPLMGELNPSQNGTKPKNFNHRTPPGKASANRGKRRRNTGSELEELMGSMKKQ
ncbi:hypothetical protein B5F36_09965 [Anaerofilum sp. An201]|nr:hypothetical protein B5F36_09965 [Anaerofilum sp. An201]